MRRDSTSPPTTDGGRRLVAGYHSRTERRLSRRAARRRKRMARLVYVAVPTVVVVVAVAVLFVLLGGGGAQDVSPVVEGAAGSPKPEAKVGVLLVREQGAVRSALLLSPGSRAGLVVGVPGITLLRFADGFRTVESAVAGSSPGSEKTGGDETLRVFSALSRAVAEALQLPTVATVAVEWAELRPLLERAGALTAPLAGLLQGLDPEGADAGQLALAVSSWLTKVGSGDQQEIWESILRDGERTDFLKAVKAAEVATYSWSSWMLRGRLAGEEGDRYLEPDVASAREVLAGGSDPAPIQIEVQNGSGLLGMAENAASSLAALGFELLPSRNAPDFPDVLASRVLASPEVELQTKLVQKVLGVGTVVSDASLEGGTIIVVLGKDYSPGG